MFTRANFWQISSIHSQATVDVINVTKLITSTFYSYLKHKQK